MDKRNAKILVASGLLAVAVAVGKAGATTPDGIIAVAKDQIVPVGINLVGLAILLHFFNK